MNEDGFGHTFGMMGMMTEITTPFVNQRFFFDKSGMREGSLYVVNGLIMTLLWFLIRVVFCGWMCYRLVEMRVTLMTLSPFSLSTVIFSYCVGYALQLFWFKKIFKGALKVVFGSSKGDAKGDAKGETKSKAPAEKKSTAKKEEVSSSPSKKSEQKKTK
jgi:hypothetical protein